MIDLVFWSFVVALSPILLGVGLKCLAIVLGPIGRPETAPYAWHGSAHHAPHHVRSRISRVGGFGHGQ